MLYSEWKKQNGHTDLREMSDADLLADLIRDRTAAYKVMEELGDFGEIVRSGKKRLRDVPGIGREKADRIHTAIEVGRRAVCCNGKTRIKFRMPEDVARYLIPRMQHLPYEVFRVLLLDAKNGLILDHKVSDGGVRAAIVEISEVFKPDIEERAVGLIACHNHPSSDVTPSQEDRLLIGRLRQAGELLGVKLLDSFIVGNGTCWSDQQGSEVG